VSGQLHDTVGLLPKKANQVPTR